VIHFHLFAQSAHMHRILRYHRQHRIPYSLDVALGANTCRGLPPEKREVRTPLGQVDRFSLRLNAMRRLQFKESSANPHVPAPSCFPESGWLCAAALRLDVSVTSLPGLEGFGQVGTEPETEDLVHLFLLGL